MFQDYSLTVILHLHPVQGLSLTRVAQERVGRRGQVADGAPPLLPMPSAFEWATSTGRGVGGGRAGDTTVHIDFTSCGHQSSQGPDRRTTCDPCPSDARVVRCLCYNSSGLRHHHAEDIPYQKSDATPARIAECD